jgi:hypothetical protein
MIRDRALGAPGDETQQDLELALPEMSAKRRQRGRGSAGRFQHRRYRIPVDRQARRASSVAN